MKIVVDANVLISAAIADGETRKILQLADATFLAPPELESEVRSHVSLVADKTGKSEAAVEETLQLLLVPISTVPYDLPPSAMQKARETIGDVDHKDVPYLATAITVDATAIWSDDSVFDNQQYVDWYTTNEIVQLYDRHGLCETK